MIGILCRYLLYSSRCLICSSCCKSCWDKNSYTMKYWHLQIHWSSNGIQGPDLYISWIFLDLSMGLRWMRPWLSMRILIAIASLSLSCWFEILGCFASYFFVTLPSIFIMYSFMLVSSFTAFNFIFLWRSSGISILMLVILLSSRNFLSNDSSQ